MVRCVIITLIIVTTLYPTTNSQYIPSWDSLDTRPLPSWYDKAKVGIFIHWGVFSVPSFGSEWFWINWKDGGSSYEEFINRTEPPNFSYQEYAKEFTAEFFDPNEWAEIFANSGAKYVVLTSKHHEGYTLWPSNYSYSWNAKDIGPHRDVLGELATAVREQNLTFGLYHSLYEWFHPLYLADKANNFTTQNFVFNKIIPEMLELIDNYKPAVLWSDGDWEAPDTYWNATEFLAYVYNESPIKDYVVVNDRWGIDIPCKHGDFYTCSDRFNPGVLQKHKWENAMTIDKVSWGFRRNAHLSDYLTDLELITTLTQTISCGGNILINVGPTKDGIIAPIFQERLQALGEWLQLNGEAVYESIPWTAQNDSINGNVWYTAKENTVYAIVLEWPTNNLLNLGSATKLNANGVTLLETNETLNAKLLDDTLEIEFPDKATVKSNVAWVVKFSTNNYKVSVV